MDGRGAVQGHVGHDPPLQPTDYQRPEPDFHHMAAEQQDDPAPAASGFDQVPDHLAEVARGENLWKTLQKGVQRPVFPRRSGQERWVDFVRPMGDGNGAQP